MDRKALRLVGFVSVAVAILSSPACKDDSEIDNERPLPGPGPIGAGGGVSTTGGAAGVAGPGGASGGTGGTTTGGTGGTSTTGGAGGMPASCPTFAGDGKLRFVNLSPGAGVDLCVVPPGKPEPEGPLFQCAAGSGLPYKKVSKAFAYPAGMYEIRTVAPGVSCATALATSTLTLGAGESYVALALGGGSTGEAPSLKALKNDTAPPNAGTLKLRFVHGIHKAFPLDLGLATGGVVSLAVFANVPFGGVMANGVNALGYPIQDGYANGVSDLPGVEVGAAKTGETAAIFSAIVNITPAGSTLSAFGFGVLGDPASPLGAIVCNDNIEDGNFLKCEDAMPAPSP